MNGDETSAQCHDSEGAQTTEVSQLDPEPGGGTLGISGWGCTAGRQEPLAYARASSVEFCHPMLE